jgi:nucleoid DNA-binding protein
MTFIEMVEKVALVTGDSKAKTKETIKAMTSVIEDEVFINKRDVAIPGFGKFKLREVVGGKKLIGGVERDIKARDTLKFVAYAKRTR